MYLVDQLHRIIRGCQENDPAAQRELYDMFRTKMFGICMRYAGNYDDAQDILQDGFIKVFDKISQFGFKGAFEGWIRKVIVNTALEKYRIHYRQVAIEEFEPGSETEVRDHHRHREGDGDPPAGGRDGFDAGWRSQS